MFLKYLSIINYKNYGNAELEFCARINCFTGNNGVGKTNILDTLHYLSLCKSYFNPIDTQNIKYGSEFFVVEGNYSINDKEERIYCGLKRNQKKKFSRNKKEYKKLSEHIGLIPLVMVSPADIKYIIEGSEERRKFINEVISQYDHEYLNSLIQYNKALTQRNILLKHFTTRKYFEPSELEMWDHQLNIYGPEIYKKRKEFIAQLIPVFQDYYRYISEGKENVSLIYKSDLDENDMLDLMQENLDKDRILQYTTKGIHKDDLIMLLEGYPLKKTGSQGQQKTFLVALKLAKYDFIKDKTQTKPILLLDDIFDKFDNTRVEKIIHLIAEDKFGQIFITDTDAARLKTILKKLKFENKIFIISEKQEISQL